MTFGFVDRRSIQLSYERTRRTSIHDKVRHENCAGRSWGRTVSHAAWRDDESGGREQAGGAAAAKRLAEKPGFEPGNELHTR